MQGKRFFALGVVAIAAACSDRGLPTETTPAYPLQPSFAISAQTASTTAANGVNSGTLILNAPAIAKHDLLIAHVVVSKDLSGTAICPVESGWTLIHSHHFQNKTYQQSYYRVAPAAAVATSYTWEVRQTNCSGALRTTDVGASGAILPFTGVAAINPIDVSKDTVATGSASSAIAPSVTTTTNGARVIRLFAAVLKSLTFTQVTERMYSVGSTNNSAERTAAAYDNGLKTTAGVTGRDTVPMSTSAEWLAQTIALRAGARIIIKKVTAPAGASTVFGFTLTGGPAPAINEEFGLQHNGEFSTGFSLASGTYAVDEAVPAGWDVTAASCLNDAATPVAVGTANLATGSVTGITVAAGETVTCTFTNTQRGKIIVDKVTSPAGATDEFDFTLAGGPDALDTDFSLTDAANAFDSGFIKAGTYSVDEDVPAGWDVSAASCVNDANPPAGTGTAALGTGTISGITVGPGQTVTCTFTNTQRGKIVVTKTAVGGDGTFGYSTTSGPDTPLDATFSLTTVSGTDSEEFDNLKPGSYSVTEDDPSPGFTFTSLSCDPSTGVVVSGRTASITLGAGQTVTCTYTNTKAANGGGGDGTTYFLALDNEAIRTGDAFNNFTAADLNGSIVGVGQRTELAWFAANATESIDLPSGQVGDEGWFALKTIPASWASAGPTDDGLRNLLQAGPGLGSGADPEALLDGVTNVTPLRATGLAQLVGNRVCAIVWDSDISINYGPLTGSLKGANRGIVAFEVTAVTQFGLGSTLPKVTVTVLDADTVCGGDLTLLTGAPAPVSSSLPADVDPGT